MARDFTQSWRRHVLLGLEWTKECDLTTHGTTCYQGGSFVSNVEVNTGTSWQEYQGEISWWESRTWIIPIKQVLPKRYSLGLGIRKRLRHWITQSWRLYRRSIGIYYWSACYITTQWSEGKGQDYETGYWTWRKAYWKVQPEPYFWHKEIWSGANKWGSGWILPQIVLENLLSQVDKEGK